MNGKPGSLRDQFVTNRPYQPERKGAPLGSFNKDSNVREQGMRWARGDG